METKWYVIRTIAGKEKKAKEQLEAEFKNKEYTNRIKQVLIPLEKVFQTRNGKKILTERNFYPGYILVEADPNIIGELRHLNKQINNVIGFLGDKAPIALKQDEVNRIMGKMDELAAAPATLINKYIKGEKVKIIEGPFASFVGDIEEINEDKKRLKLNVKVFGRGTSIELEYAQVEKNF
jgi:transcription termination/antitermination protein NusG